MLEPYLSAPSAFAALVSTLSASSVSALSMFSFTTSALLVFGLFTFSRLIITQTQGRQKLIELNQRKKKATSEELALVFISLLLSKSLFFFAASYISKK